MVRKSDKQITQDTDRYICSGCEEPCLIKMQDEGIGAYEYWGIRGVHHDYVPVSECCGDDIIDQFTGRELVTSDIEFEY